MVRPFLAYSLTAIILLSQTGLPLHMHYCKGMLESVSVFVSAQCDDHQEIAPVDLPACCQKMAAASCEREDSCCDDEITVLLHDFDSLLPHFDKWNPAFAVEPSMDFPFIPNQENQSTDFVTSPSSNSGPPIYILFHSLIYYA